MQAAQEALGLPGRDIWVEMAIAITTAEAEAAQEAQELPAQPADPQ